MSVFSYDLGKESIGYCVRNGYTVQEMGIDLVDSSHASITERGLSGRRRAIRTRLAHKMRETWFRWFWTEKLGLADLPVEDDRWHKEFSRDGILYNGASIRVAMLQGLTNQDETKTPLEDWQLFKGVWSLIQRRGYGAGVAWGEKEAKEGDDQKLVEDYKKKLTDSQLVETFHLPAYLETFRLGVWHPISPNTIECTQGASPLKVRNDKSSAPREMVVAELKALVLALKDLRTNNIAVQELTYETLAYGDAQTPYASYYACKPNPPLAIKPFKKLRGSFKHYKTRINGDWFPLEWEGVLSQKTPRFDNRILSKCVLLPRYSVARNKIQEGKNWYDVPIHQAKALMFLKNIRFMQEVIGDEQQKHFHTRKLTADELKTTWETFLEKPAQSISATWLNAHLPKITGAYYFDNKDARDRQYQVFKPDTDSGRSRFSRPAATLLRDCLLSGLSPQTYVDDLLDKGYYPTEQGEFKPLQPDTAEGKRRGLTPQDLHAFAKRLGGESWDNIHIADNRDDFDGWNQAKREAYIEKVLIGTCMNNVVRNRLQLFYGVFKNQVASFGTPEYVVLEFVRGDMSITQSKKKKDDYNAFLKANTEKNNRLRDELKKAGICNGQGQVAGKDILRLQLLEEQGRHCLYTGRPLSIEDVRSGGADIEHSVPFSRSGTGNRVNLTLADAHANKEKGNKTPYEYMMSKGQEAFNAFAARVMACDYLPKKKKELLLSPDAESLVSSYNGLADTAHISRLVQQVVAMYCGKGLQVKDQDRFVYVMNGQETSQIGRHLDLYKYLLDDPESIGELEPEDRVKKLRDNRKHHALDAYIISWYREYTRRKTWVKDENTTEVQKWCFDPAEVSEGKVREVGREALEQVIPKYIKRNKIDLDPKATFYGIRHIAEKNVYFAVERTNFQELMLKALDTKKREKVLNDLMDKAITNALMPFVNDTKAEWDARIKAFKHPRFKNTPNKVTVRYSSESKAEDITIYPNGRIQMGKYYNMAKAVDINEPFKNVQLKCTKENIGQILYYNQKEKVSVQPIYPYIGLKQTMKQLKEKGYKLYKNGMVFNSGCLIHLSEQLVYNNIVYEGTLELGSLKSNGQTVIKKPGHKESSPAINIKYLIDCGLQVVET
jgi:CRISPR-associated endonuclease Csn1